MGYLADKRKRLAQAGLPPASPTEQITKIKQGFIDRAKLERARFKDATDSEYWVALCFHNRAEKEAFLKEFGLSRLGDKYLDGNRAAERLRKKER